jgi:hypothetical protein
MLTEFGMESVFSKDKAIQAQSYGFPLRDFLDTALGDARFAGERVAHFHHRHGRGLPRQLIAVGLDVVLGQRVFEKLLQLLSVVAEFLGRDAL